jgi:hypothetical protein
MDESLEGRVGGYEEEGRREDGEDKGKGRNEEVRVR